LTVEVESTDKKGSQEASGGKDSGERKGPAGSRSEADRRPKREKNKLFFLK